MLFRPTTLWPEDTFVLKVDMSRKEEAFGMLQSIPGCSYDEKKKVVRGEWHALGTLLELSGHPVEWESALPKHTEYRTRRDELPDYQRVGASAISAELDSGVMCNDEVGLGKTIQTIAGIESFDPACNFARVILCPASLKAQWRGEIEKWCEKLAGYEPVVHVVWPESHKNSKKSPPPNPDWVIAYYLDVERALALVGKRRYILVADEVQNLRGYKTNRAAAMKQAANYAAGRVLLTASPLYNDVTTLWPILDYAQPGKWGKFPVFAKRYAGARDGEYGLEFAKGADGSVAKIVAPVELRKRLDTMSFRRVREDVADQLPFDMAYQTVWLDPPEGRLEALEHSLQSGDSGMESLEHFVAMSKVEPVRETVEADRSAGVPSIVFTHLKDHARALGAVIPGSLVITGDNSSSSTRLQKVYDYVARCNAEGVIPCVVATGDSLGTGGNLQMFKSVNLADMTYSPDDTAQWIGRIARMGQSGKVQVRFFIRKGTPDERKVEIALAKLSEQTKLAGRNEKSKVDLRKALSPASGRDLLREMYEQALKEERDNG